MELQLKDVDDLCTGAAFLGAGGGGDPYIGGLMIKQELVLIIVGCYLVLRPFLSAVLWAVILVVTLWPLYVALRHRVRPVPAASIRQTLPAHSGPRRLSASTSPRVPRCPGWRGGGPGRIR